MNLREKTPIFTLGEVIQFLKCRSRRYVCLCMLFVAGGGLPAWSYAEAISDVRVLIDVSGSMKKNDPANLRTPAVKMLVGLMPENTRSGIWTFGRYVNMQVKLGQVNKQWKQQAMLEAERIHSRGLFTNIEDALKAASADWQQPDPRYDRHIILLTDGMVDIAKDARLNEQSRQRILDDILPRLETADATIHSIALSENTDETLLSTLSGATKGSFVQTNDAEQLQKVFFRLFEKSVKPDTLPLEDNKFTVDKHVSDITVLVFLAEDSPPTQLTLPDGQSWSKEKHPDNVSWHHDKGYDLITVKAPADGEWTLQARVDPDNRVMVVTNIRLKVDKLPNTIILGEHFDIRARLLENGKTITNKDLLARTEFEVKQIDQQDKVHSAGLQDSGEPPDVIKGDGIYSTRMDSIESAGDYELSIRAKSLTFKRAIRHSLQVYDSPATLEITQQAKDKPFVLKIRPHSGLIRPESVSMQYRLDNGEPAVIKQLDNETWSVEIPAAYANKTFNLTLAGTRYSDEPVKMDFEQVVAVTDKAQSVALKIKPRSNVASMDTSVDLAQAEATAPVSPSDEQAEPDAAAEQEDEHGFSWWIVLSLVAVVNALLLTGLWLGFRKWRKNARSQMDAAEAGLGDMSAEMPSEPELQPDAKTESQE